MASPVAGSPEENAGRRRDFALAALLVGLTLLAYWPCLHGDFLWDDDGHVTRPDLRGWAGLGRIWFSLGATHQYYPVLHSAFWLEHRLWGDAALGYHLINVLLHATSALLLVVTLRRLWGVESENLTVSATSGLVAETVRFSKNDQAALLAGLIFALHPICVESVAWISEQKNTLSTVFYLLAAGTYLKWDTCRPGRRPGGILAAARVEALARSAPSAGSGQAAALYWTASLFFILALLSKTVTVTLPTALLVVLWWRRGRLAWRMDILPLAPWLVVGVSAGLGTAWVERRFVGAEGLPFDLGLIQRCLLAGRALWFYAAKAVWPADLIFIYPHWHLNPARLPQYVAPLAAAGVLAGLWEIYRRTGRRGPLASALFFAGTLFPALGFFNVYPFRYAYVADHFQYLACLGLIVPAAVAATAARRRWPGRPLRLLVAVVVIGLGSLTWRQAHLYRNDEALYRATLARNPDCWMAENNLGEVLARTPARLPEAIAHYRTSLRLNPAHAEAENNLGLALAATGDSAAARSHYEAALRIDPEFVAARNNLANALIKHGEVDRAIGEFERALRADPGVAETQNNLGNALLQARRVPEAIAHFQTALQLNPDYVEAHNDLAAALFQAGRIGDAVAEFKAALRIRPNDPTAGENLRRLEAYLRSRGR